MGFWKKIFGRHKKNAPTEEENNWEEIIYDHKEVDFQNEEQRSRYVTNCLEQIMEASRQMNELNGEYSLVTAYLTDMEEIEALPEDSRREINQIAGKLLALEEERNQFLSKKERMRDSEYYQMRRQEQEVSEGIAKLKEAEKYGQLIKQDLKRLDRERHAYEYRRKELLDMQTNLRGMAVIFVTALTACMVMLAVLQFVFEMNTYPGYFITILAAAVAMTVVCVKYMDAEKETQSVERAVSKLIQLQNRVKIRYVNNKNLLDYLCVKYDTDSAAKLQRRWELYQEEKEERKQFAEAEAKTEYYQDELIHTLSRYRISDTRRWINQVHALLDPREMVEVRHELIVRRQALRQNLDYNKRIIQTAREEIMGIVKEHPEYGPEIMEMVDRYDQKGEIAY